MENSFIDLIIRIKNGYMAQRERVVIRFSKMNESILAKLKELGYISAYEVRNEDKKQEIEVELLYQDSVPAFTDVKVQSTPGKRFYVSYKELKPVLGGLGHLLISTPRGILTNTEARKEKVGGELLFIIW